MMVNPTLYDGVVHPRCEMIETASPVLYTLSTAGDTLRIDGI